MDCEYCNRHGCSGTECVSCGAPVSTENVPEMSDEQFLKEIGFLTKSYGTKTVRY